MPIPPFLDPSQCQWGLYPYYTKPWTSHGANNDYVGYLEGVLNCQFGQSCYDVHAPPGPWYFGTSTRPAVENAQSFFGLTVDGIVGPQTWGLIDWGALGFPT